MPEGACNCKGDTPDCAGGCGGTDVLDECDVCNGPGIDWDNGVCDCAGHKSDVCGICDGKGIVAPYCDC